MNANTIDTAAFFLTCYLEILNNNQDLISEELQKTQLKFEDFIDNVKNFCFELLKIDIDQISLTNKEIIKKILNKTLNENHESLIGYLLWFQIICDQLILSAAKSNKYITLSVIIKILEINDILALKLLKKDINTKNPIEEQNNLRIANELTFSSIKYFYRSLENNNN